VIYFEPLRTRRLNVQLRELTIQQAIDLAATPPGKHEIAMQQFLACAVESSTGVEKDPHRWTVQERMMVLAQYLSAVSENGRDFAVGNLKFTDFLHADEAPDFGPDWVPAGQACGSAWRVHQINGAQAAAMEAASRNTLDWHFAELAIRMRPEDDTKPPPDAVTDPELFSEWLASRMAEMKALPESDYIVLFRMMRVGLYDLRHIFIVELDADGFNVISREQEGGQRFAGRFRVDSAVSDRAHHLRKMLA
jgi:hypothetical protein